MGPRTFLEFLFSSYPADSEMTVEVRSFAPEWSGRRSRFGPRFWKGLDELEECADEAQKIASCFDVYFGVLPRVRGGGGSEHLRWGASLWIDFDSGEGTREETLAFAIERIGSLSLPPPSILIRSGGGYHGYWVLSSPVRLESDGERESFRKVLVRFARAIGGDLEKAHACPVSTDCARILRLPGTFNLKRKDEPRPVEILRMKRGDEKSLVWWSANLPPLPLTVKRPEKPKATGMAGSKEFELPWLSPRMEAWLTEPVPNGKKHKALVATATRMRMNDQSEMDTLRILTAKAANCGVNVNSREQQDHIEEIVTWVFAHVLVDPEREVYYKGVEIGSANPK